MATSGRAPIGGFDEDGDGQVSIEELMDSLDKDGECSISLISDRQVAAGVDAPDALATPEPAFIRVPRARALSGRRRRMWESRSREVVPAALWCAGLNVELASFDRLAGL